MRRPLRYATSAASAEPVSPAATNPDDLPDCGHSVLIAATGFGKLCANMANIRAALP